MAESAAVDPSVVTDTVSAKNGGFFGPLASVFEAFLKVCCASFSCGALQVRLLIVRPGMLQVLDQGLTGAGIPYSYGFAIILLTILVKLATYPLSKQQVICSLMYPLIVPF